MKILLIFLLVCGGTLHGSEPTVDSIDYSNHDKYLEIAGSLGNRTEITSQALKLKGYSDLATIRNVLNWMDRNLKYDANRAYTWRNFDDAIKEKTYGGCADRGVVCGVLLKGAGIPTIWVKTMDVSWIWDFKKGRSFKSWAGHVFLEVYVGKKWMLLDPGAKIIYKEYSPKARIMPGNRFAYHKGNDPKDMIMSLQWEEWKKQTETYFRSLDESLLPVDAAGGTVLSGTSLFAKQVPPPPKYDEAVLKKDFDAFMESVDILTVSKDYPKAVRKLLSGDPEKQIQAVKTLAATGEIEAIPWLLLFLEAENNNLRIWTGSSLEKLVSSHVLKRRDMNMPEFVVIKSLRPGYRDLRPLAWVVLKMFRKPDDGNTHAYAASMTRYLGLHEFERELEQCLESRHPAVSNKAKWALESLERQKEYEKATSNKPDAGRRSAETIDFRLRIRDKSSNEKVITKANLIRIKQFILKQGLRETYCNMYNNNPAFRTKSFSFYLNPDTGQENINCDTDKSDFHTLTIRKSGGGKNQYRTVEFLDKHYVYIVVSWPTKDLTVSQAREFVIEAIKDILKEMEREKPNKPDAGDGK